MTTGMPLTVWLEHDGALLRLRLNRPKANIIDAEMIAALDAAFREHAGNPDVKAVLLDAEGPHFSFGASVEEHLPAQCRDMLRGLHALILRMVASPVPVIAAVQGQCLGGGLEVALAGHRMVAAPDARLGQPEIRIGVFAPAASCLLPERVGRPRAEDLLLSGRGVDAAEAAAMGLVDEVAEDPRAAAVAWFERHLAGHSGASLRYAVRAARAGVTERLKQRLDEMERLYADELMETRDAIEGLEAFLAKRPAEWENR